MPLTQPLHPLNALPLPTGGMFLKAWIVFPHSCCHMDVLYPEHVGLGARGAGLGAS